MKELEPWRRTWRLGFAPLLPTEGLEALARALARDDSAIIQHASLRPLPTYEKRNWPVEAADPVAYCYWQADDNACDVEDVEELWSAACTRIDEILGDYAACRYFHNWWDENLRSEVVPALLEEVKRTLHLRKHLAPDCPPEVVEDWLLENPVP